MSVKAQKNYDLNSIVDLLIPRENNINLVPLKQIVESDAIFIWATLFWNICAITLGAIIALTLISYENISVMYLLYIFAFTFFILALFFTKNGISSRKAMRNNSQQAQAFRQDLLMRKLNQLQTEALVYRFHRDLGIKVFESNFEIDISSFKENLNRILTIQLDNNLHNEVVNKLIEEGMIFIEKNNGRGTFVKYNSDFVLKY